LQVHVQNVVNQIVLLARLSLIHWIVDHYNFSISHNDQLSSE